jgi:hypothetical protein
MANSLQTNPVFIDDFSTAIDLTSQFPFGFKVHSIEWVGPKGATHAMVVKAGGEGGVTVFCAMATGGPMQNIIKYFYKQWLLPLYIPKSSGVTNASGSLVISHVV